MLLALRHFWEISVRGLFFFFFFPQYWWHSPTRPFAIPYMWSPPLLISCLASINKKVHFNSFFFTTCHQWTSATFPQRSNQQCLDFPCAVLSLLLFCCTGEGLQCIKAQKKQKKKAIFFASVVSKEPQPSKRPLHFQGWQLFRQKLHPGCRDCTNPCSCTVLTI